MFGFNLGVEIGQIIIIAIVFPILYLIREQMLYRRFALQAGAVLLGLASLYLLIERIFVIDIPIRPFIPGI